MQQPLVTNEPVSVSPPPSDPVDTATLELLASWRAEDATSDPVELRKADEELTAFKKSMNEHRAAVGACPVFP